MARAWVDVNVDSRQSLERRGGQGQGRSFSLPARLRGGVVACSVLVLTNTKKFAGGQPQERVLDSQGEGSAPTQLARGRVEAPGHLTGAALMAMDINEDDEVYWAADDETELHELLLADDEYHALEAEAQEAYEAIQQQRNTLRQAREKQHAMRQNRKFFPGTARGSSTRPMPSSASA